MAAHILLLEPNKLLASQYKRYLEELGYRVSWCQHAQNGINMADVSSPDIVIVELLLSAHSGIEFLYEFRSYNEWRQVPAIILSRVSRADISASDRVLKELGVRAYLYKPETSLKRLGEKLETVLVGMQTEQFRS